MYIELGNIFDVENIDDMIDNSFNGTCFSYSWFLKLKDSFKILKIYNSAKELQGFMPIFKSTPKTIAQSTMYIPYGGLILFSLPREGRNQIRYIRQVEKVLCNYLQENYDDIQFSLDNKITDIMPFIRSGFTPEVRYTYKLDLTKGLNVIYQNFGGDRKKDIKKAVKRNIKFVVDSDYSYFDSKEAMKWEKKYGFETTSDYVEKYIKTTIKKRRGMCFVAMENNNVLGGVHIAWDKETAYIMYSYYEKEKDDVAIAFLYYKIFEYLINNKIVKYIDFEGSVFESIEDWNISFGAYQSRFYNLHWNSKNKPYFNLYDYGEK